MKTLLFFITGNKSLITDYSNATFEARGIGQDYLLRLNWFDEIFNSLVEYPLNIFLGGGSKFGGTIGLNKAYAQICI